MPTSWLMILLSTPLALASRPAAQNLAADALMANPSSSERALPRAPTHAALEAIELRVRGQMQKENAKQDANPSSGTALLDSGANSAAHMEVAESPFRNLGPNSLVSEASLGDKSRLHKHDASTIAGSQVEARKGAGMVCPMCPKLADPGCLDWCVGCDKGRVLVKRATANSKCTAEVECDNGQTSHLKLSNKTNPVLDGLAVEPVLYGFPFDYYEGSYSAANLEPELEAHFKNCQQPDGSPCYTKEVIDANIDGEVEANWQQAIPTSLGKRLMLHESSVETTLWKPLWGQLCNACGFKKMDDSLLPTALTDSLEPTSTEFPFNEKCLGKGEGR